MIAVLKKVLNMYFWTPLTRKQNMESQPLLQGKEAMLSENGTYKIIKVPIVPPEK
jgi:hypothetical protein